MLLRRRDDGRRAGGKGDTGIAQPRDNRQPTGAGPDDRRLKLAHAKDVVALVAPELFPAGLARHDYKVALGLALGAPAIDGLFWHVITSKAPNNKQFPRKTQLVCRVLQC